MAAPTDAELREMAKERVGFRAHAGAYIIVNLALAVIWFLTGPNDMYWPAWSHFGWGVGLAFHAWGVFGGGRAMEEREYERLKRKYS